MDEPITTLIAGASPDLVEAARLLGRRGERVALIARAELQLSEFRISLDAEGIACWIFPADVTEPSQVMKAFTNLTGWSKRLDRLIYNAGVVSSELTADLTGSEMHRVMSANLFGFVNCFQLAHPMFKRTGGGHAVIVSNSSAYGSDTIGAAYTASKASLQIYAATLRRELADENIRISELHLGKMQDGPDWRYLYQAEVVAAVMRMLDEKHDRYVVGEM
ncbi:SDR family NAD(P)-dependent oxidoreductase [candidate division KSB1 bacterium]|nr:MAG: SDR family NAD(P)-dependent oxidoreductase [candidate division KSB1 bacterium]